MAIPVQDQLLPGREQGLEYHLVCRGSAISGKKSASRAKRLCRDLLRFQYHASRFHERVEHGHGHGQVRAKDMLTNEMVKITGPGAVPDRVSRRMSRRMPGILGHQHVILEL